MSPALDDTDLSGMTPEAAREYVLAFIKSLKETQRQRDELAEELDLWVKRIELAEKENRTDLVQQAKIRLESIRTDVTRLDREEGSLKRKVDVLKVNLKGLPAGFQPTVNAEQLLVQLEMVAGERDETEEKFQEMKVQSKLEELKLEELKLEEVKLEEVKRKLNDEKRED